MLLVAVDFDGTIVKLKPKFTFDLNYELYENCSEVLNRLRLKDVDFVLNTARTGVRKLLAILYIKTHRLPIKSNISNSKPSADIYIDDKNLECKEINWLDIEKQILQRLED